MYSSFVKRVIDFLLAMLVFLLLLPVFLVVTVAFYSLNDGQPFFYQRRPGLKGRLFKVIKFKTMNDKKNAQGELLSDEERLTAFGKWVRKTSMDEIPQLFNVMKGDMSLVGPRPLLEEYLPLYSSEQARRHDVRPGITGWAQVNGRNEIAWEKKFELDVWYVDHLSWCLDLKIVFLTIYKVFKREGINSKTSVTMEKFKGTH
jgi:undecaprenyl phosphate N,N'-diacetylbacillosamine 1-phosphate transferase